jgi:hypothetical protein
MTPKTLFFNHPLRREFASPSVGLLPESSTYNACFAVFGTSQIPRITLDRFKVSGVVDLAVNLHPSFEMNRHGTKEQHPMDATRF